MGAEKLHHLIAPQLREHNIKYGRDKFYYLLREHGLLVKRRKRGPKTTNSNHFYRKYSNLIREIELFSSGRLWVSDITYIRTGKGFVYPIAGNRCLFEEDSRLVPLARSYERRSIKRPAYGSCRRRSETRPHPSF